MLAKSEVWAPCDFAGDPGALPHPELFTIRASPSARAPELCGVTGGDRWRPRGNATPTTPASSAEREQVHKEILTTQSQLIQPCAC